MSLKHPSLSCIFVINQDTKDTFSYHTWVLVLDRNFQNPMMLGSGDILCPFRQNARWRKKFHFTQDMIDMLKHMQWEKEVACALHSM
jgi:hypothetical protein